MKNMYSWNCCQWISNRKLWDVDWNYIQKKKSDDCFIIQVENWMRNLQIWYFIWLFFFWQSHAFCKTRYSVWFNYIWTEMLIEVLLMRSFKENYEIIICMIFFENVQSEIWQQTLVKIMSECKSSYEK